MIPPPAERISIVIFAKNEEQSLGEVLRSVKGKAGEVIVVDGRSTDATRRVAETEGARVVTDGGRGKGAAQRVGIAEARGDVIVFMDADGSDDVAEFDALVAPILADQADLVIGSRFAGGSEEISINYPQLIRTAGNIFINATINRRWGANLTDTLNCYRAIRANVARSLDLIEDSAAVEHEMVMKCLKTERRVMNVPTHEFARKHGQSKINPWRIGHRFFICLFKNLW